jgi:hypothetical protein
LEVVSLATTFWSLLEDELYMNLAAAAEQSMVDQASPVNVWNSISFSHKREHQIYL